MLDRIESEECEKAAELMTGTPSQWKVSRAWNMFCKENKIDKSAINKDNISQFINWYINYQKEELEQAKKKQEIYNAGLKVWENIKDDVSKVFKKENIELEGPVVEFEDNHWLSDEKIIEYQNKIKEIEKEQSELLDDEINEHNDDAHNWAVARYRNLESYKLCLVDIVIRNKFKVTNYQHSRFVEGFSKKDKE